MSISLTLYNIQSETNRINKSLENPIALSGNLKESCSIENPVILIDMGNNSRTILYKNYAYIDEFERYYFITDSTVEGTKLLRLTMRVDVLMTYSDIITQTPVLIERSEGNPNKYLVDNLRPIFNYPMTLTKKFPRGFDDFHFYLTTTGI